MTTLYRPGGSWLHRAPAWTKILGLLVLGLAVLLVDDWRVALTGPVVAVGVLVSTGASLRLLRRPLAAVLLMALVVAVVQVLSRGWEPAVVSVCRILTVVLLAWAVTMTTTVSAMREVVVAAVRPLRPLGVRPDVVGMTVALAIRCIPLLGAIVATAQEARRARGVRPGVTSLAVPVVVRSVRLADQVGDALLARGYDPEAEERAAQVSR